MYLTLAAGPAGLTQAAEATLAAPIGGSDGRGITIVAGAALAAKNVIMTY